MTAREKFKIGEQVGLSADGIRARIQGRRGTIVGYGRKPQWVRVEVAYVRRKGTGIYHMDFWDKVLDSADDLPANFGEV